MRDEYDFSNLARGKLYSTDAKLNQPVYLDQDVEGFVQATAEERKTDLSTVVNQVIRGDMVLADSRK